MARPKSSKPSRRKRAGKYFNRFFGDRIYVINLYDKVHRWENVNKQFKTRGIKAQRFIAVDGRCKDQGNAGCLAKKKTLEMAYDIKISQPRKWFGKDLPLKELIPASSLTIGTMILLRNMIKHKYPTMLICEDDIKFDKHTKRNFEKGIKELTKVKPDWDLLYLGCGQKCGHEDISEYKKRGYTESFIAKIIEQEYYIRNYKDLRTICDKGECKRLSSVLSTATLPGGTWCYAYSLKGAKKVMKRIAGDAGNHIDMIIKDMAIKKQLKIVAFDPPIIWHSDPERADSDIPWKW